MVIIIVVNIFPCFASVVAFLFVGAFELVDIEIISYFVVIIASGL